MTLPMDDPAIGELFGEVRRLADVVHGRLVEAGRTVAVAESLTGGLIGAVLTEAPGTSVTFRGLVVYTDEAKRNLAGVDPGVLERYGAVHPVVARQLAAGARDRLGADYGVGVTGVAGPGTQDGHPVGEVYAAIANGAVVRSERYECAGHRQGIRLGAARVALELLIETIEGGGR